MGLVSAALAALAVLAVAYAVTRRLPTPNPGPAPCRADADCLAAESCVNGACVDADLGGLVAAAQAGAQGVYGALTAYSAGLAAGYYSDAMALWASAMADGLPDPVTPGLQAALETGLAAGASDVGKALAYLKAPGCDPTRSVACGYYAQATALTAGTATGTIIAVTGAAPSAALVVQGSTGSFVPVATSLSTIVAAVQASAQARGVAVSAGTQRRLNAVAADAAALNDAASPAGALAALLAGMTRSAAALRDNVLPVGGWRSRLLGRLWG